MWCPVYTGAALSWVPKEGQEFRELPIWAVVKIRVPFGVLNIMRHLLFRVPKSRELPISSFSICKVHGYLLNQAPALGAGWFGNPEP